MTDDGGHYGPLFFLVAGEASGDLLGARLMKALKKKTEGHVCFAGIGGPRMKAEGIDLLFPQEELAHMGLFELVRHIPKILLRIHQTINAVKGSRPAALITIDAPDFSFRVAKALKGQGIPLIHYVAPTVWAWRPGRAKKIAQFLDHLLVLLPFEPPYFTTHGLGCTFVGHPLVESGAADGDGARFREKNYIPEGEPLLALLPGSRAGEVQRLLPVFRETVYLLLKEHPNLQIVVPTVPSVEALVKEEMRHWPVTVHFTDNDADKYDAFAAAQVALACSGTVSVELAMANLPTIIAYKASPLTVALYRRFIKIKYATLLNIMQDRPVMPEFLQEKCTAENLCEAVDLLLVDDNHRALQKRELESIGEWLGRGLFVPSEKAADTVWTVAFPGRCRPLRVMQVIPALGTGGAEQATVDMAAALVSRGDYAFVVSTGGRRVQELERAGAIHLTHDVKTKNPIKIIRNAYWLADLIRKERIDLLHVRSRAPAWSVKLACDMTGCAYVSTFHAAYKFSGRLKKYYNHVMARADRVIAISSFIARHIKENYKTPSEHIKLVNRGVDLTGLDPHAVSAERIESFCARSGIDVNEKAILVPARLSPIKGQDTVIGAAALMKERGTLTHPVLIVGDDQGRTAYSQGLKALIARHGLSDMVHLVGACGDMPAAYAVASVVVVPSKVPEGFGRVPVEAMAMGVPVIASNLGAVRDTILDRITGWLIPPDDAEALSRSLEMALKLSKEDCAAMAAKARAHVAEHYSAEQMIEQTLAVYDELMEERNAKRA